jgi:hypothetical protein
MGRPGMLGCAAGLEELLSNRYKHPPPHHKCPEAVGSLHLSSPSTLLPATLSSAPASLALHGRSFDHTQLLNAVNKSHDHSLSYPRWATIRQQTRGRPTPPLPHRRTMSQRNPRPARPEEIPEI